MNNFKLSSNLKSHSFFTQVVVKFHIMFTLIIEFRLRNGCIYKTLIACNENVYFIFCNDILGQLPT